MNPGISFPLREAELPHESKRKTEVAKTRNFSRSAVGKHLLVRGYDCYDSPFQSAVYTFAVLSGLNWVACIMK